MATQWFVQHNGRISGSFQVAGQLRAAAALTRQLAQSVLPGEQRPAELGEGISGRWSAATRIHGSCRNCVATSATRAANSNLLPTLWEEQENGRECQGSVL